MMQLNVSIKLLLLFSLLHFILQALMKYNQKRYENKILDAH